MWRIAIVEDHPLFRDGLVQCLEAEDDLDVVGVWGDEPVDPATILAADPDAVVMDVELPGASGIELTRALRAERPQLAVVLLTGHADSDLLFGALQAGAAGYLLKHTPPEEVVSTLRTVAAGGHVLTPEGAARILRAFGERGDGEARERLERLSPREEEVLRLLATGESNRQLAKRLFVSEETIKSHVASIFRKLEVSDRTRAAVIAVKAGLVDR